MIANDNLKRNWRGLFWNGETVGIIGIHGIQRISAGPQTVSIEKINAPSFKINLCVRVPGGLKELENSVRWSNDSFLSELCQLVNKFVMVPQTWNGLSHLLYSLDLCCCSLLKPIQSLSWYIRISPYTLLIISKILGTKEERRLRSVLPFLAEEFPFSIFEQINIFIILSGKWNSLVYSQLQFCYVWSQKVSF